MVSSIRWGSWDVSPKEKGVLLIWLSSQSAAVDLNIQKRNPNKKRPTSKKNGRTLGADLTMAVKTFLMYMKEGGGHNLSALCRDHSIW